VGAEIDITQAPCRDVFRGSDVVMMERAPTCEIFCHAHKCTHTHTHTHRHRSNPYTAASHFSIASELSGVPRERDIRSNDFPLPSPSLCLRSASPRARATIGQQPMGATNTQTASPQLLNCQPLTPQP